MRGGQGPGGGLYPPPALTGGTHDAGWSSPVARQAHNLKVTGSNPVPATIEESPAEFRPGFFAQLESLSESA